MTERRPTIVLLSMIHYGAQVMCPQAEKLVVEELYLLDFNVISQPSIAADEGEFKRELEDVALRNNAAAVARIYKANERSWVLSLLTREGASRKINFYNTEIDVIPNDDTAETTALKIVEALQARLIDSRLVDSDDDSIEIDSNPLPDANRTEQHPTIEPPPEDSIGPLRHRFRFFAAFAGEFSPGGTGVMGGPGIGARWLPIPRLSIGIDMALGVIGKDVTSSGSSSTFDLLLGRVRTAYEMTFGRIADASLGISIGPAYVWTKGTSADETASTRSDKTVMLYLGGGFEVCLTVMDNVWFPLYLNIGALPQRAIVEFEGKKVAMFGLPIVEFGIGAMFVL